MANRGEIAVRVIRTLRRLGVRAVLAASVPDRHSLAARLADATVLLEGHTAADTYLDIEAVIAAARAGGCEAVHPGYGLLSERPDFARACADAGLVFIGPSPETLTLLGDKVAARDLAIANGVPVAPGAEGTTDAELAEAAREVGYPLMLKARGGGGGLGMRLVTTPEDLAPAIEAAPPPDRRRLRRRPSLRRALRPGRPPRRGPGARRRPRQCRSTSASATARCNAATRSSLRRHPVPLSTHPCAPS